MPRIPPCVDSRGPIPYRFTDNDKMAHVFILLAFLEVKLPSKKLRVKWLAPESVQSKKGISHHVRFLYSAHSGYRDILASFMTILTENNPPHTHSNTTNGSQCHTMRAKAK